MAFAAWPGGLSAPDHRAQDHLERVRQRVPGLAQVVALLGPAHPGHRRLGAQQRLLGGLGDGTELGQGRGGLGAVRPPARTASPHRGGDPVDQVVAVAGVGEQVGHAEGEGRGDVDRGVPAGHGEHRDGGRPVAQAAEDRRPALHLVEGHDHQGRPLGVDAAQGLHVLLDQGAGKTGLGQGIPCPGPDPFSGVEDEHVGRHRKLQDRLVLH